MFEDPTNKVEQVKLPQAFKKAEEVIGEYQIEPQSFDDLYDKEQIAKDLEFVLERKKKWANQSFEMHDDVNKKLATVFESIIFDQGESSEWLGSNAFLIKTSEYDDFKNGVDAVAEYDMEEGVSRVAMAIDVTFNHNIQKKISKIKENIRNGILTEVKYFESQVEDIRGQIKNIPHIIVGADVDTVRELANAWVDDDKEALAQHGVQFQFFEEAILQCKYFAEFAEANGQTKIKEKYNSLQRVLEAQLKNKNLEDKGTRDSFMKDFQNYFDF
ncbi:hypothetical protein GW764_03405 [Candidatus Parcubacteria bacterium]|nr:hypothetical protein [Candidatus Parcubacteria bacterium]